MRIIAKSLAVVAVSLATWLTTSTILAQIAKTRGAKRDATPAKAAAPSKVLAPQSTVEGHDIAPGRFVPAPAGRFTITSLTGMPRCNVTVVNRVATVDAVAQLLQIDPEVIYVWRLRVRAANSSIFATKTYVENSFNVGGDHQLAAPFLDRINVPKGASRVVLSLYKVDKQVDMQVLEDDATADKFLTTKVVKEVRSD